MDVGYRPCENARFMSRSSPSCVHAAAAVSPMSTNAQTRSVRRPTRPSSTEAISVERCLGGGRPSDQHRLAPSRYEAMMTPPATAEHECTIHCTPICMVDENRLASPVSPPQVSFFVDLHARSD
jgi:hypothetical protein